MWFPVSHIHSNPTDIQRPAWGGDVMASNLTVADILHDKYDKRNVTFSASNLLHNVKQIFSERFKLTSLDQTTGTLKRCDKYKVRRFCTYAMI